MGKKVFYITAPGKSINDIKDDEWEFLKDKNTIAFSHFPLSGKKTKYHFSFEEYESDVRNLNLIKRNGYTNTILLLGLPKTINYARSIGFRKIIPIIKGMGMSFRGYPWTIDQEVPICKFNECRAFNFYQPLFRYRGSLSAVINSALVLGAKEIRLVGVDLNSQYYFFDGEERNKWIRDDYEIRAMEETLNRQKYLIEKRKKAKSTINDYNPNIINDTNMPYYKDGKILRNISDVIVWMDKEIREEGMYGIYTTSKKSDLYNRLEYKSIMDD